MAWIETSKVIGFKKSQVQVATREGGVDRNNPETAEVANESMSPPARVAWIETTWYKKELKNLYQSPPARVAWIETDVVPKQCNDGTVATREGGVDRNFEYCEANKDDNCRHPRGWRG